MPGTATTSGRPSCGAPGTFILTTGRSGSTMLARALHTHPEVVVVSDLLEPALSEIYFDPLIRLDGVAFWDVLSRPSLPERIRYWRTRPTDELLLLPDEDDDVSLLMAYTLPFLTAEPWELHDELRTALGTRPERPATDHFAFVLDFLRDRFGGTTWIERTGGSLPHAASIVAQWPTARFLVLRRDPVETALSMRSGSFFRLYLAMKSGETSAWLDERFADPAALAAMIEHWTVDAEPALAAVPADRLHHLTYERLLSEPVAALADVVRFVLDRDLTAADTDWATDRACGIDPPPRRAEALSAADVTRIRAACPTAIRRWDESRSNGS
ncbi:MAG: sulfotransferase [Ilumatobacter sp.]|nr:sulfotransferase [Ilumatobacter sp.]